MKSEHQKSKMFTSERTLGGNSPYTNRPQNEKTLSSSDKLVSSDHESAGNCPSPDYSKGDKHGYESFRTFGRGRGYSRGRYSSKGYRERGDARPKMNHESFNSTHYKDDKYTSRNTFDSHKSVEQGDVEKDMDFDTREFQQKKENYYYIQKREKYQGYRNMHDNRNFRTKSANYNQREKGDVREHKSNSAKYSPRRPGEYTSRERKEEKSDLKDKTVVTKGRGNWDLEHKSEVENSIKIEKDKGKFKENSNVKFSKGRGRGRKTANEKKSDNDFRTETTTTNKLQDSKIKGKCENEHKSVSKDIEYKIMENRAENCVNDYDSVKNGKNEEQSLPPGFPVKRPPPGFTKIGIDDRTSTVKPPPGFENVEKTS
ncbi:hypothetical protein KUTeg_009771 [Tegillarca granosa]|uniref:Uncharacterized protein n=1 Tax=Tegillarca granosa TaxID=220873 RepID=A0ABQ9F4U8_TEGGR|nr:hypothetical protein KUTeg_009771 [Tegillarca granosa]